MVQRGLNKILLTGALAASLTLPYGLSELLNRTTGYDPQEYLNNMISHPYDPREAFENMTIAKKLNNLEMMLTHYEFSRISRTDYVTINNQKTKVPYRKTS